MSAVAITLISVVIVGIAFGCIWIVRKSQTVNTAIPLKAAQAIETDFAAKKASEAERIKGMSQEELGAQLNRNRSGDS